MKLPRGFKIGVEPTNTKGVVVIAAQHDPRSVTWRWALYWHAYTRNVEPRSYWFRNGGNGHAGLRLPWRLGTLVLSWQPHVWRRREDGSVIA